MVWQYSQSTGELTQHGVLVGTGYSGFGEGRNNPEMQNVPDLGPIPQGTYIIGKAYDHHHLGPCVMNLEPVFGTNTFGRSAFRLHGNNKTNDASHGCIIMGPNVRHQVALSPDRKLAVVV